jgi:hypothetical protein
VEDDDFDYDGSAGEANKSLEYPANQQPIPIVIQETTKADFKKFLPTKEQIRRKCYISDSVIAEREDEDELDPNNNVRYQ